MPNPVRKLTSLFAPHQRALRAYRGWVERLPLDPHAVLLEQQNGLTLDGSVYYILRELLSDARYAGFDVRFVVNEAHAESFPRELASRGLAVPTVVRGTSEYMRALATSTVLVTDNALPPYYVKRPGQILLNTWHGIPLKTLGRSEVLGAINVGNVQRNLALADFLLMPNPVMEERFVRDYMLRGLSKGTVVPLGYPRNEAFLGARGAAGDGCRRYAWLPTFRGVGDQRGQGASALVGMLDEFDQLLRDDETLYLKLHLVEQQQVDLGRYRHILPSPTDCELYDFLATCDALVTDYSSVLFDFPLGGGKVVLFPYDEETYLAERGLYDPLDSLPFPQVRSVEELARELRAPIGYDNEAFVRTCWPSPTEGAAKALCERLLLDGAPLAGEHPVARAEKPVALVYSELGGDLEALRDELLQLSEGCLPLLAFPWGKGRGHERFLYELPADKVAFVPLKGELLSTLPEKALVKLGKGAGVFALDRRRAFGDTTFDRVIIHDGSDQRWIGLMRACE